MLVFKADLIRHYPLGKTINSYGFFSYSTAEALHLSDKEDGIISGLFNQMTVNILLSVQACGISQGIA